MRKHLQKLINKTELLVITGWGFDIYSDWENKKYESFVRIYPGESFDDIENLYSDYDTKHIITLSESEEILKLLHEDKIPYTYSYTIESAPEIVITEIVQHFKLEKKKNESNKEIVEQELAEKSSDWTKLSDKQKSLVLSIITELAKNK